MAGILIFCISPVNQFDVGNPVFKSGILFKYDFPDCALFVPGIGDYIVNAAFFRKFPYPWN